MPQPDGDDSRQTPETCAKLDAVLVVAASVPLLSVCAVLALTAPGIVTLSRYWSSSPPLGGISTKPTATGKDDGSVAALATQACPLTSCPGGTWQTSTCVNSLC